MPRLIACALFAMLVLVVAACGGADAEPTDAEYAQAVVSAVDRTDFALARVTRAKSMDELVKRMDEAGVVITAAAAISRSMVRPSVFVDENEKLVKSLEALGNDVSVDRGAASRSRDPRPSSPAREVSASTAGMRPTWRSPASSGRDFPSRHSSGTSEASRGVPPIDSPRSAARGPPPRPSPQENHVRERIRPHEHGPDHRDQGRRHRRRLPRRASRDLHGARDRDRRRRHVAHPRRRGAAAPRRRSRPRGRDGLDRRPGARHRLRRHGQADLRPRRRADPRPALERDRRADRRARADRRPTSSAGRSTAIRPRSATSRRRSRPSRRGSRSSTSSRRT